MRSKREILLQSCVESTRAARRWSKRTAEVACQVEGTDVHALTDSRRPRMGEVDADAPRVVRPARYPIDAGKRTDGIGAPRSGKAALVLSDARREREIKSPGFRESHRAAHVRPRVVI